MNISDIIMETIEEYEKYILNYDRKDEELIKFFQKVSGYNWLINNSDKIKSLQDYIFARDFERKALSDIKKIVAKDILFEDMKYEIIGYVEDSVKKTKYYYDFDISLCESKHDILEKLRYCEIWVEDLDNNLLNKFDLKKEESLKGRVIK